MIDKGMPEGRLKKKLGCSELIWQGVRGKRTARYMMRLQPKISEPVEAERIDEEKCGSVRFSRRVVAA